MKLKTLRQQAGISLRKLSVVSGVGYTTICNIECGKHKARGCTRIKLAQALNIEPNMIDFS
jgi:transcriptional regulator with XRE-family HTH domain